MPNDKLNAIIISFNPSHTILDLAKSLLLSNCQVIIVDNGSNNKSSDEVLNECASMNAKVIRLNKNFGVAAALNYGIGHSISRNFRWSVTFDQDSIIDDNFISNCLSILSNIDYLKVGIFAPVIYEQGSNNIYQGRPASSNGVQDVDFVITSGMVINIQAFLKCQGFNEKLFIDYVDYDFCLKIKNIGMKIIIKQELHIYHKIGSPTVHRLFGKAITTTNHNSMRRYYKHRNFYLVIKNGKKIPKHWIVRQYISLMIEPIKIIMFENNKAEKLKMIINGAINGILNNYETRNDDMLNVKA